MVLLAYTMHGSFHDHLWSWVNINVSKTTVAIMAVRVFAMYRRSRKMGLFLILCFMAASASRGVMDGLALSPSSGSICESSYFCDTTYLRITAHVQQKNTYFPERESASWPRPSWCPSLTAFQVYASNFYFSSSLRASFISTYLRCREHSQIGDLMIVFQFFLETICYIFSGERMHFTCNRIACSTFYDAQLSHFERHADRCYIHECKLHST
jgi:hypothetical protein